MNGQLGSCNEHHANTTPHRHKGCPLRFTWEPDVRSGGCGLWATPEDYDGSPMPSSLRVEFTPRFSTPGRSAAAAVLAFEPFISGSVTFDKPISPELANAISNILRPRTVWPGPLELHPKAIVSAPGVFRLECPVTAETPSKVSTTSMLPRLRLPSSGAEFGHTFGPGIVAIPSNAHLLSLDSRPMLRRLFPYLAVVVLVAEDIGVGFIQLPTVVQRDELFASTRELLRAVGIRLTI